VRPLTSGIGTKLTCWDVRVESEIRRTTDIPEKT
jgi:hypothetical protein